MGLALALGGPLAVLMALAAMLLIGPTAAVAQVNAPAAEEEEDEEESVEGTARFVLARRELRRRLELGRRLLEQQEFAEAVDQLGGLLSPQRGDTEEAWDEQDYFFGRAEGGAVASSLKNEALRLLGRMPARGREIYQLRFGEQAERMLEQAIAAGDVERLQEVSRRFFHTQAGYRATMLVGRHYLDLDQPLAAALAMQRVADSPGADAQQPQLALLLATSWYLAGEIDRAAEVLADYRRRSGDAPVPVGGTPTELFATDEQASAWLRQVLGERRARHTLAEMQWVMFRGNAARNAVAPGGLPLLHMRWRVPVVNDPLDELTVTQLAKQYRDQRMPALPSSHPLAVNNVVLMRNAERLVAVDLTTGKRIWEFPWSDNSATPSDDQSRHEPRSKNTLRGQQLRQRMWRDAPFGQMSSDGQTAYLLDDVGFARHNNAHAAIIGLRGVVAGNPDWHRTTNKLVALDLERQGSLRWLIGGETGEDEPRLAGAFFLGAPLTLSGRLYALAEVKGELRLVVIDGRTGQLQWQQQLVHVDAYETIVFDATRRLGGAMPSFADGVLVCPTSTGSIVAVDIANRTLLWGYAYKRTIDRRPNGVFMVAPIHRNSSQTGAAWADSTVTIDAGRVIATPVDSDKLHCLDLLTGKPLWTPTPREDGLMVGCVVDDKAVIVGRDSVKAIQLADGKPAWNEPVKLPDRAMPSGHGFLYQGHYYLPTTTNRLLKIDVASEQVAEAAKRIVSQTQSDIPLGNLVCYRGQVVSQGVKWLTSFYQRDHLEKMVAERLARNADDAWALERRAMILLEDGQTDAALEALRRAVTLRADEPAFYDITRDLLVKTLLGAIGDDYAANEALLAELESLVERPSQMAQLLRVKAAGLKQAGRLLPALDAYAKLSKIEQPRDGMAMLLPVEPTMEQPAPGHRVRRDRWIRMQVAELLAAADEQQLAQLNERVAAEIAAALREPTIEPLARCVELFALHDDIEPARLELARRQLAAGQLLPAELLLIDLVDSDHDATAAAATALTARVLQQAGRWHEAAAQYRLLAERWPSQIALDGRTGEQLLAAAEAEGPLADVLAAPRSWARGKVEVEQQQNEVSQTVAYRRTYPLNLHRVRGPVAAGTNIAMDQSGGAVLMYDGLGNEQMRIDHNQQQRLLSSNYYLTHGKLNGHLLLMSIGFEIVALNTLPMESEDRQRVLWREDRSQLVSAETQVRRPRVGTKVLNNPWGRQRRAAADQNGTLLGGFGPLASGGVFYQKLAEVRCVDPISGTIVWARSGYADGTALPDGCELFGDEQHLIVAPPDGDRALILRIADGSVVGTCDLPEMERRWTTRGRYLLAWDLQGGRPVVQLHDPLAKATEQVVWSRQFDVNSKGCVVEGDELAIVQPNGRMHMLDLLTGEDRFDAKLQPIPGLAEVYVLRSQQQYLVVTNRHGGSPTPNVAYGAIQSTLLTPMLYDGRIYAFDRDSGQPLWKEPAKVEQFSFPLDQPGELPILVLMRNATKTKPTRTVQGSVLCLDRRDGSVLLARDDLPSFSGGQLLVGDPQQNRVTMTCFSRSGFQGVRTTFTFKFSEAGE